MELEVEEWRWPPLPPAPVAVGVAVGVFELEPEVPEAAAAAEEDPLMMSLSSFMSKLNTSAAAPQLCFFSTPTADGERLSRLEGDHSPRVGGATEELRLLPFDLATLSREARRECSCCAMLSPEPRLSPPPVEGRESGGGVDMVAPTLAAREEVVECWEAREGDLVDSVVCTPLVPLLP